MGGNIDADPLFVSEPQDLQLAEGSPCLSAGLAEGGRSNYYLFFGAPQRW